MPSSSTSETFSEAKLEALKISAYLDSDMSTRKTTVDRMAAFGAIAVPYISELIRSLQTGGKAPKDLLEYCEEKIRQLTNVDH